MRNKILIAALVVAVIVAGAVWLIVSRNNADDRDQTLRCQTMSETVQKRMNIAVADALIINKLYRSSKPIPKIAAPGGKPTPPSRMTPEQKDAYLNWTSTDDLFGITAGTVMEQVNRKATETIGSSLQDACNGNDGNRCKQVGQSAPDVLTTETKRQIAAPGMKIPGAGTAREANALRTVTGQIRQTNLGAACTHAANG